MKLVLSRKGFDSSTGGVPSPIFPDGSMVSLPIPDKTSAITYGDIRHKGAPLAPVVAHLTTGRIAPHYGAHLDPDVVAPALVRQPGWRPLFGQTGPAQGHLKNHCVGAGDLFLFFGLFRRLEDQAKSLWWAADAAPCHVLWGWLQVAEVIQIDQLPAETIKWARYHPHFQRRGGANNTLYIARKRLMLAYQNCADILGAGVFPNFSLNLQLTETGSRRASLWSLPPWFNPSSRRPPLTYHANTQRWKKMAGTVKLLAASRGQEFILDCDHYPEAISWVYELISTNQ
ncbi:MAG: hypothetical protein N839_0010690 [Desulfofustis sp. PB-SRB1]|jgi:hypothetical protein|nr:hypothetical protein [Desulfofustis sp. PB-SRB1]MBM1002868.1 hypothetical protein [Desulfofustis sp. PB-SRB1]HBH28491.1 hypothetical protein [Desulfofustis sp.]HBH30489.1 hypothetical protein [Desulfofustis sp.]